MTALAASLGFIVFTVIYLLLAGAIIFHLRAYALPGWNGGRISIAIFVTLSLALFALLIVAFLRAPWGAFN